MKPKILFILHYPPPLNGGASFMGKLIKESSILNSAFETDFVNLTTSFNLNKVGKGGFNKFLTTIKILIRVIKALIAKRYNLCYMTLTATGPGFYKDFLIVFALKIFRNRIIFHFHNKGIAKASKNKFNDFLYRFAFHNTQSILLSRRLYPDVQKYVRQKDVFYCPNGIPQIFSLPFPNPGIARSNKEVCQLLFFSNIMVEKGVYVLLQACSFLKEKKHLFECHFVGDWVDITEEDFRAYIKQYHLEDYVFAHGPKYNQEKSIYFLNAHIFVFPSFFHNETFGLVNLEAMQYCLPIVSTPEGGIPDVVVHGETGFLVPQQDAKALTDSLENLMTQPELCLKMGLAGRKRYDDFFTADKFENNLTNILEKEVNHL